MDSEVVIRAEGVGKRYRIGGRQPYKALRDTLTGAATAPFRLIRDALNPHSSMHPAKPEDFWALKDVSFEIKCGEVVGLIGRNGAGKSTLLKILSQITEPTTGRIELEGRVGSLLEVGTGFHPELTGRENIFLNGAILGMKRREIIDKFDQIVEFAEIEKFIDTPVKHYSSGMYMRLAFSVAAHLEPEILLVDEVLAVGDVAFQKKCLGKMEQVSKRGRTVLFVSHNMGAIEQLTYRCVELSDGRVAFDGDTADTVSNYLKEIREGEGLVKGESVIQQITLLQDGKPVLAPVMGKAVQFRIKLNLPREITKPRFSVNINDEFGNRVVSLSSWLDSVELESIAGIHEILCSPGKLPLNQGQYSLKICVAESSRDVESIEEALAFAVIPSDVFGNGRLPNSRQGQIYWQADWRIT